jgi:probable HAF family extracellular repeat protein
VKQCWLLGLAMIVTVMSWAGATTAEAGYIVVDLGVLAGGSGSSGSGINATGIAAGTGQDINGQDRAIRALGGGPPENLTTLSGGRFSFGAAINSGGVVVGSSEVMITPFRWQVHGFLSSGPGSASDLGVLTGGTESHATGINDSGLVVGYGTLVTGTAAIVTRAFETVQGSKTLSEVGLLPGGSNSRAEGVNAFGSIVGSADNASGVFHAFRSSGAGQLEDLGSLSGPSGTSFGLGINDFGIVVGKGAVANAFEAFRSKVDGTLQPLGFLNGTTSSSANAINDAGTVVGSSSFASGASLAFLYSDETGLVDLNALIPSSSGWVLNSATGINGSGQITGTGTIKGQTHAFRLDPASVPEPSALTLALTGLGLARLVALARRTGRGVTT